MALIVGNYPGSFRIVNLPGYRDMAEVYGALEARTDGDIRAPQEVEKPGVLERLRGAGW